MALASFTDSHHRFVVFTFGFSSINREINCRVGYGLSLGIRFRQKSPNLASIHRFLRVKN